MFENHLMRYGAPPVACRNICSGGVGDAISSVVNSIVGAEEGVLDTFAPPVADIVEGKGFDSFLGDAGKGLLDSIGSFVGGEGLGPIGGALSEGFGGGPVGVADAAGGVTSLAGDTGGSLGAGIGGSSAAAAASPFGDIAPGLGSALDTSDIGIGAAGTGAAAGESAIPAGIANAEQGASLIPGFGGIGGGEGAAAPGAIGTAAGTTAPGLTSAATDAYGGFPPDLLNEITNTPDVGATAATGGAPALTGAAPASTGASFPNIGSLINNLGASGAVPANAASGGGGILNSLGLGGASDFLKDNKSLISLLGLGGSLGKSLLFPSQIPGAGTLNSNAGLAQNIAQQNGTGSLTPQQQQAQQQTTAGQIAAIKSKYASLGLSGSTAEQNDIATAQNKGVANSAATIQGNASTALGALGVSNAPTLAVANQQMQQDQQLSQAIALLAAAGLYSGSNSGASS